MNRTHFYTRVAEQDTADRDFLLSVFSHIDEISQERGLDPLVRDCLKESFVLHRHDSGRPLARRPGAVLEQVGAAMCAKTMVAAAIDLQEGPGPNSQYGHWAQVLRNSHHSMTADDLFGMTAIAMQLASSEMEIRYANDRADSSIARLSNIPLYQWTLKMDRCRDEYRRSKGMATPAIREDLYPDYVAGATLPHEHMSIWMLACMGDISEQRARILCEHLPPGYTIPFSQAYILSSILEATFDWERPWDTKPGLGEMMSLIANQGTSMVELALFAADRVMTHERKAPMLEIIDGYGDVVSGNQHLEGIEVRARELISKLAREAEVVAPAEAVVRPARMSV